MRETITLKDVYMITERENSPDKAFWTRVGVGFVNRDNSINIILDALPVNGRLHLRDRRKSKETQTEENRKEAV